MSCCTSLWENSKNCSAKVKLAVVVNSFFVFTNMVFTPILRKWIRLCICILRFLVDNGFLWPGSIRHIDSYAYGVPNKDFYDFCFCCFFFYTLRLYTKDVPKYLYCKHDWRASKHKWTSYLGNDQSTCVVLCVFDLFLSYGI